MSYTVDRVIDIIENNRPKPRSCVKFPCGICNKSLKNNHKTIQCDSCDLWIHIVCNDISDAEYECLKTEYDPWYCLVCFLKYNLNNVPFTRCDNSELNNVPFTRCDNSELNNVPFTRCDNSELNNVPFTRCDNSELNNVPFTWCDNSELNNVPFTRCDNSELNNISTSNSMRFLESLPNVEMKHHNFQMCQRMKLVWKYPQNRVQIITQLKILKF